MTPERNEKTFAATVTQVWRGWELRPFFELSLSTPQGHQRLPKKAHREWIDGFCRRMPTIAVAIRAERFDGSSGTQDGH